MKRIAIDGRLLSVGSFVRQGAQFADIGTDHAYLPIYLLQSGRISFAAASDINEGPLESARKNAAEYGVEDKMSFHLADGLGALANCGITDVAIAGMGGELISDILTRADFIKKEGIRLILQPMSRQGHLRRYLEGEGFSIIGEKYSYSVGKYYVTICAEYSGKRRELQPTEAELGKDEFLTEKTPELCGYLKAKKRAYEKMRDGKIAGGEDASLELLLCEKINQLIGEQ